MKQNLNVVIIIGLVLLILILCFFPISRKEGFESKGEDKVFVINLPKDKQRFQEFKDYYDKSDMKHHPLHTFTAVIGKDVNSEEVLAEHAKPQHQFTLLIEVLRHLIFRWLTKILYQAKL